MQSHNILSLLRRLLTALGLSAEAIDDIVERIEDFLSVKDEKSRDKLEYPYSVRDHFLSPAEHSFFMVLKSVVSDSALISIKVALGDLFSAKSSDPSKYRIYTNKIDRKHVDFLLCDPKTVQPILGIELDDKSHFEDHPGNDSDRSDLRQWKIYCRDRSRTQDDFSISLFNSYCNVGATRLLGVNCLMILTGCFYICGIKIWFK